MPTLTTTIITLTATTIPLITTIISLIRTVAAQNSCNPLKLEAFDGLDYGQRFLYEAFDGLDYGQRFLYEAFDGLDYGQRFLYEAFDGLGPDHSYTDRITLLTDPYNDAANPYNTATALTATFTTVATTIISPDTTTSTVATRGRRGRRGWQRHGDLFWARPRVGSAMVIYFGRGQRVGGHRRGDDAHDDEAFEGLGAHDALHGTPQRIVRAQAKQRCRALDGT